ncbi:unnamed protein product [Moneuplotes crassus]|uniref:Uncharacterized protein n=1 Tax=Euplotes crassus TaxID=5936 RepID=A0AAD1UJN2_EUPCR|nr:unnamed protein product [Moneuplotes crassus]
MFCLLVKTDDICLGSNLSESFKTENLFFDSSSSELKNFFKDSCCSSFNTSPSRIFRASSMQSLYILEVFLLESSFLLCLCF